MESREAEQAGNQQGVKQRLSCVLKDTLADGIAVPNLGEKQAHRNATQHRQEVRVKGRECRQAHGPRCHTGLV